MFPKINYGVSANGKTTVKLSMWQFDLYQLKGELVRDAAVQVARINQDPLEELRQGDDDAPQSRLDVRLRGQNRVMRTPARTESVAVLAESGIKQGLQHL
jgi:hypothetical protein